MSRPLVTLVLWILFAAFAFGWRTYLQVRRYGDTGWRFTRSGDRVEVTAQVAFVASIVLSVAAPVAAMVAGEAHLPGGIETLSEPGTTLAAVTAVVGVALMVAGSVLAVVAQVNMGASWRIGVDDGEHTELVTHGLFAQVRNPIFTGMLLAVVGEVLLVPNAIALLCLVTAVLGLQLQVRRVEEPYLVAEHGGPYVAWASRTGRFLPGVGRLSPPSS